MATTERPARKTGGKRRKATTTRSGFSLNTMMTDALKPLLLLVGIFIGKFVHDLIEGTAQTVVPVSGLGATAVSIVKPAAILAGGLALKQFWQGDFGTYLGYGIAAYGGVVIAKEALNFNVLGALAPGMSGANLGLLAPATPRYPMNSMLGLGDPMQNYSI